MPDVESLRAQLRDRGYLTHGIERWFALDPWSSRAFWLELVTVSLKAAILIAAFAALPMTAIMVFRDAPLGAVETLGIYLTYALVWVAAVFAFVVLVALILKVRPALPIDTPRALLAISVVAGGLLVLPLGIWWARFDTAAALPELAAGVALAVIFFLVATVVLSAALLSFSIYEVRRIPAIHQKPRTIPITIAALALIALLFVPAWADRERLPLAPMVVTMPTSQRVALIAVDGLTYEILRSRPDIQRLFPSPVAVSTIRGASTTERWASLGTGVPVDAHGVRAIEGVRFRGGTHVLQRISPVDFALMRVAPFLGIARREPLPPTVRRRDYVWEIFAERGVPSLAVNWWTTADTSEAGLYAVGPESIFTAARGEALRVDAVALERFLQTTDTVKPRFATVYLPALDVILNRLPLDQTTQLATSLRALDGVLNAITLTRARGYDVVLAGMPGDGQSGSAVVASTLPFRGRTAWDVAPMLLDTLGFPLSTEMPGTAASTGATPQPRIGSYGPREEESGVHVVNEEYYENLKSLGYIR